MTFEMTISSPQRPARPRPLRAADLLVLGRVRPAPPRVDEPRVRRPARVRRIQHDGAVPAGLARAGGGGQLLPGEIRKTRKKIYAMYWIND